MQPTSQQQEDEDLAQALAMSQQTDVTAFQGYAAQETGVVGQNGGRAVFGPATREYYEANQWAMVPLAGAAVGTNEEVIFDTSVEDRVYRDEPRMLKPLPGGDYTASLLTICAHIEGARERLLMRDFELENYGKDAEWWRGHPISMPKIVHIEDGRQADPDNDNKEEIVAEVQRLMALLSTSERSYGSAQALTQTNAIKNGSPASTRSRTLLEMFMEQWAVAAATKTEDSDAVTKLFNTTIGTNDGEGMVQPDMSLIDMQVAIPDGATGDLFELLDGLLWNTDLDGATMADNYIERPADVLVMRVFQASKQLGEQLRVEAPAQFYVDKYLKDNIEATRATREQMAKGKKRINKIEEIEKKLRSKQHPNKNEMLDAGLLLQHTLGHFSGQNRIDVMNADKSNNIAVPEDIPANPPHYTEIAEKLKRVIESIDAKLVTLGEEKEKTRKAIAEMSKAPPPGMEPEDQKHRYTLRGVATKPGITYVSVPRDPAAATDEMTDENTSSEEGYVWWRLEYDTSLTGTSSVAKLTRTTMEEFDVLRAVELEYNSALLVYASERMNASHRLELPPSLQTFIEQDDALLEADIHRASIAELPAYNMDGPDIPRQSIERTSMDSTRVEGGGSDFGAPSPPAYEDEGFMEHHEFGLGPDIKQGYTVEQMEDVEGDEAPVHEIKLDDLEEGNGEEMVQKGRETLIPGLGDDDAVAVMKGSQSQGRGRKEW
jgi:hypothetical protein